MTSRAPDEPDSRREPDALDSSPPHPERRTGRDRRGARRVRLSLDIAMPVSVRSSLGQQRGLARNISEGGMLVELSEAPPIGSRLEVTIPGVEGSEDAPDAVVLTGEVRHHMTWQYASSRPQPATKLRSTETLRGVGIRFVDAETESESAPLTSWIWSTGHTLH